MYQNYEFFFIPAYFQKAARATKITKHHNEGVETEKLKKDFLSK